MASDSHSFELRVFISCPVMLLSPRGLTTSLLFVRSALTATWRMGPVRYWTSVLLAAGFSHAYGLWGVRVVVLMNSTLSNTSETDSEPFTDTFRSTDVKYDGGEGGCAVVESLLLVRRRMMTLDCRSSVLVIVRLSLIKVEGFDSMLSMGVLAAMMVGGFLTWLWE